MFSLLRDHIQSLVGELKSHRPHQAAKKPELRDQFGFVTARAVAALNVPCEYCLPYVKKGRIFVALKGAEDECDIAEKAIKKLGGEVEKVIHSLKIFWEI